MATVEYWIQIEEHAWDVCPRNIDRMTGQTIQERDETDPTDNITLTSPETGASRSLTMYKRMTYTVGKRTFNRALILRRYKEDWKEPDDRKVNPWDLNEPDPTDKGTMGTIPGAVIECNVGDTVKVHFRNKDTRDGVNELQRTHSLHPHGFVFTPQYDGAYPLSPPDLSQPIPADSANDWAKVGAKDFKQGDRVPPGHHFTYTWRAGAADEGWPSTAGVWLYHDHSICDMDNVQLGAIGIIVIHNPSDTNNEVILSGPLSGPHIGTEGTGFVSVGPNLPDKAQYLLLLHTLGGAGMCINGRKYLGNTPTLLAGPKTVMRFGVVSMGSDFHTFHLHGHRWILPGPDGTDPDTIQSSPQIRAVSQFEDTRTIGPANSLVFTIRQGSFMGTDEDHPFGEYHMHCHVLMHMGEGMMGSLLVWAGGPWVPPNGVPCPSMSMDGGTTMSHGKVNIHDTMFDPQTVTIDKDQSVTWTNNDNFDHTVTADDGSFDSQTLHHGQTFPLTFKKKGTVDYHCNFHPDMKGTIKVK